MPLCVSIDSRKSLINNSQHNLQSDQTLFDESTEKETRKKIGEVQSCITKNAYVRVHISREVKKEHKRDDESCSTDRRKIMCNNNNYSCLRECTCFLPTSLSFLVVSWILWTIFC